MPDSDDDGTEQQLSFILDAVNVPGFTAPFSEYPSESHTFKNKLCANFAGFRPPVGKNLFVLSIQQFRWGSVDLLILPLRSITEIATSQTPDSESDESDDESHTSTIVNLTNLKLNSSTSRSTSVHGSSIEEVRSHDARSNRSSASIKMKRIRSQSVSRLRMIPSYLGLSSVSSAAISIDHADTDPNAFGKLTERLINILNTRTKFRIAEVSLAAIHSEYLASKQRLGLMSFAIFVLKFLSDQMRLVQIPISGFLFTHAREVEQIFPAFQSTLAKILKALRDNWRFTKVPVVILLDEFGLTAWSTLRDNINGLVLTNTVLEKTGELKIRSKFVTFIDEKKFDYSLASFSSAERAELEKQMKLLKAEISLRDDFAVFAIEVVTGPLQPHLHVHLIKFFSSFGFKFWISKSDLMEVLEDVKPSAFTELGSDMIEIATVPSVTRCLNFAEMQYLKLFASFPEPGQIKLNGSVWSAVMRKLTKVDRLDLWSVIGQDVHAIDVPQTRSTVYCKPAFPEPPAVIQNEAPPRNNAWFAATARPSSMLSRRPRPGRSVYVKHIGLSVHAERQQRLCKLTLNVLRDLHAKNLLASARYNNDLGSDPNALSASFTQMITVLRGIADPRQATPAVRWLLAQLADEMQHTVISAIRQLVEMLRTDVVSVWTALKVTFIPKDGSNDNVPCDTVWAITDELENGKIVVYVSDAHPSLPEAVLHAYFKHLFGWRTGLCVMAEALVTNFVHSAQKDTSASFKLPIPSRIITEVQSSCRSKMLSFVRNSFDVVTAIEADQETPTEAQYLKQLCSYVDTCVEYLLLKKEHFTDQTLTWLNDEYAANNFLETKLTSYLGQQTLLKNGLDLVTRIFNAYESVFEILDEENRHNQEYAVCYLVFASFKACRRCAYLELKLAVADMSTQTLPERDQVAVCLEMATTQTNLQKIFYLSSLQLSPAFHRVQRKTLKLANIQNVQFESGPLEKETGFKNLDFSGGRQIGNAYIYIYPILVDIILNASIGSGLYFSSEMNETTLQAATVVFLGEDIFTESACIFTVFAFEVSFPFLGALMNSFGRTMSFYFYQKSISVMIIAVSHRLAASMSFLVFVGSLVAVVIYFIVKYDWMLIGLGFLYSILLGIYMIMYAILVAFRDPEAPFYKSPGPLACVQSILIMLPAPFISRFAINGQKNSSLLWGLYVIDMALAVAFMLARYRQISRIFLDWPTAVKITTKADIEKLYETVREKPVSTANEIPEETDRKLRLWERQASEWFSNTLAKLLRQPGRFLVDAVMKKRLKSWLLELSLMTWFMQRSNIDPATVKVFSPEWNALAKQAVDTISKKFQIEKLNRGALLYQLEAPAIVFGFLYFIIIFMDKWAILIATGKVGVFIANASLLNEGITFATIYFLLSSGFLELTIGSCSARINEFKYQRVCTVQHANELMNQYQSFSDEIYRSELRRLLFRTLIVFVLVSVIMTAGFGLPDTTRTVFWTYAAASISYTGLLVGLFNKIFISVNEHHLNYLLIAAIVFSLAVSVSVIYLTGNNLFSLLSTGLSCWLFGLCCIIIRHLERTRSPYFDISIGPNLRTSGQRFIGYDSNVYSVRQQQQFIENLLVGKESFIWHIPNSKVGAHISFLLKEAVKKGMSFKRDGGVLSSLLDDFVFVLRLAIHNFENGQVKLREVPGSFDAGGVSYSAVACDDGRGLLEIFVASVECDFDEEKACVLCEAIVHEVAESNGWAHSTACVMEVLFQSLLQDSPFRMPDRVKLQLSRTDRAHREKISARTQRRLSKACSLGIDIDRHWGDLRHDERAFLVLLARDWNRLADVQVIAVSCSKGKFFLNSNILCLIQNTEIVDDITRLCQMAPTTLLEKIKGFTQANRVSSLPAVISEKILMTRMTIKISAVLMRGGEFAKLDKIFKGIQRQGNLKQKGDFLSVHVAVFYFALTCDPSFGREVSHLPMISRTLLSAIFNTSKAVFDLLNSILLYSNDSFILDFRRSAEMGLAKIIHYKQGERRNDVAKIEVFDGVEKRTVAVSPSNSPVIQNFVEVRRYDGMKAANWEPSESDKPSSSAFVQVIPGSVRITHECFYEEKGKVKSMHVYSNDSNGFPKARYVFDREVPTDWTSIVRARLEPVETHEFILSGPLFGMVERATVNRIHKVTKAKLKIQAEFRYDALIVSEMPKWAIFTRHDIRDWEIIVEYAPFTDPNSPMLPWSVRYFGPDFEGAQVVKYDYSHPKHVITKTVKANAAKFERLNLIIGEEIASPIEIIGKIPAVFARDFDEKILRKEAALQKYWRKLNVGNVQSARAVLEEDKELLNNVLQVTDRPAARTRLKIRYSDLLIMGSGGDSEVIAAFDQITAGQQSESSDILNAICLDSGTWPTGGGGVGSCRRDVVDSLNNVRWTALAEIAGAEIEHKDYQIEKNLSAIIYLPIFDNDFGDPMENIYKTLPVGNLFARRAKTTNTVITTKFVPLVVELIDACLTENLESRRVEQDEHLILSLYDYFRTHDWRLSWNHPSTQKAWMSTFLQRAKQFELAGIHLNHESPTLAHVSMLFTLFSRLLLVLSREIPVASVVHVSHHGTQSLIAVVAKSIHKSSIVIWDHGMLWRERLFSLCRDTMPSFSQIGFVGLTRFCTRLAYYRADYVTPCTNVQNVMWAAHLAGGKYLNDFERTSLLDKCSPVLNGMNLKRFSIKRELALKTPTAVMLSHISPVKDVMNAIKAAYYIVHEFKLSSYQLHIYGSPHTDMAYTLACNAAIKELNIEANVFMKGLGNPSNVLPTGWIFVNSSITEGLPLAIGEAGLCGLPVVCTDVGGSREVISDLKTGVVYGSVVPPSRPRQLAIGQIEVLSMTGGLDVFVNPQLKTVESVADLIAKGSEAIERRIMDPEVAKMRERLGEMFCLKTQSVFSVSRESSKNRNIQGESGGKEKKIKETFEFTIAVAYFAAVMMSDRIVKKSAPPGALATSTADGVDFGQHMAAHDAGGGVGDRERGDGERDR
ncbi:hypothetical protein HDU84_000807 [Entophlyctis sp. JEL0112]|nr:hypothetical protein HDU84_000807 [Entophlyctis sp. JEL0112]